jgi:hypothetical protein
VATEEPEREFGGGRGEREPENRVDADSISGNVVQARDVQGGIHIYSQPEQYQNIQLTPKQLPADVRGFVNRAHEITRLGKLIAVTDVRRSHSVVVIVGSAGVGKTALALHWMHRAPRELYRR